MTSNSSDSAIPEHLTTILEAETQQAIRAYKEAPTDTTIHSFQFVFPITIFQVGVYIFPFAQQYQEHLLAYKYKWKRNTKEKEIDIGSDLWYRPTSDDVGFTLTFECLDSEEKIVAQKLTTEIVVASSLPIEKPRCFIAQSQLIGEVQYIQNKLHTKSFGSVASVDKNAANVVISTDCGSKFELSAISSQIWKLELTPQSNPHVPSGPSYSVLESSVKSREPLDVNTHGSEQIEVSVAAKVAGTHLSATIHKSPFRMEYGIVKDAARTTIQSDGKEGIKWIADEKRNFVEIPLVFGGDGDDVQIYGLGERTTLKKNNRKFYMWNDDAYAYRTHTDPLYHCYPFAFFVHPKTRLFHAFYFDNPGFQVWNCADKSISISALNGLSPFRYYVLVGESPQDILCNYTYLTGRMPLPPLWVLGYQQCRWSYFPDARVREVASGFRQRDIPCDVLWLDIDYMDGFRCFTWHKERFPDPKGLIEWLHSQKFKVVCMIDPAIKEDPNYWVYKELIEGKHFSAIDEKREKPFVGSVWAGPSVFPDYTQSHTREWWGGLYKEIIGLGVDGFWNDMNEPTIFHKKEDSVAGWVHHADGAHRNVHNLYGMLMARSTYEGLCKLQPNQRPFVLSRAGCAGVQRYAWMWTGDNRSIWKDLRLSIPMCLGMGLSGVAGCGVDIGGFSETCTPELYARFIQLGSLLPLSRTHSMTGTPDQEPWSFGKEVEEIAQKYIKLRYKLIPYLYTQIHIATKEGTPVMRPIWFDREKDTESYKQKWEDTEFILGKSLLVAPVLEEGATKREVYLPAGNRWVNFYTKKIEEGGNVVVVDAPLTFLPLFVAEGAVIPMYKEAQENVHESRKTGLEFVAFGENLEKCEGEIYLDDGESRGFEKGDCAVYKITKNGILWGEGPQVCTLCFAAIESNAECKKCVEK